MSAPQVCTVFGGVAVPGISYGPSAFVSVQQIGAVGSSCVDEYSVLLSADLHLDLMKAHYQLRAPLFEDIGARSASAPFRAIQDRLPARLIDFSTLLKRPAGVRHFVSDNTPLEQMKLDIETWHPLLNTGEIPISAFEFYKNLSSAHELVVKLVAEQPDDFAELLNYFQDVRQQVFDHGRWFSKEIRKNIGLLGIVPAEVALIHYLAFIKDLGRFDKFTSDSVEHALSESTLIPFLRAVFEAIRQEKPPEDVLDRLAKKHGLNVRTEDIAETDDEDWSGVPSKYVLRENVIAVDTLKRLLPMLKRLEGE